MIATPLLYVCDITQHSQRLTAPVHVHGKHVIVSQVVAQEIRDATPENNGRFLARLEEIPGNKGFDGACVVTLRYFLDERLLVCVEQCEVVIHDAALHAHQSMANSADDATVYLLGDRIAQGVEEPVQNLHWRDEGQRLPAVHDPVVAGCASHHAPCALTFV